VTRPQRHASHRLALVPLLRGVDDDRLGRQAAKATEGRFGPGQAVRTQGEPADRLPLLLGECLVWSVSRADLLGLIDDVAAVRHHVMVHLASSVR
jgi:hypothetical protein